MVFLIIVFSIFLLNSPDINAKTPYYNYNYDNWGESVQAPQAYLPSEVLNGEKLGIGELNSPEELFTTKNNMYIVDTGNNRIIILDNDYKKVEIIDEFIDENGNKDSLNKPSGIFVKSKLMFIADTKNSRIVILNPETGKAKQFGAPKNDRLGIFDEDYNFEPKKIIVDRANRIYIISKGEYRGLMQFSLDGKFMRFIGSVRVSLNPVEQFWRRFSTEAQRERMNLLLPIEYNQFYLDKTNFILAVSNSENNQDKVRRLDPSGVDRLHNVGRHPIIGDLFEPESRLVDILGRRNNRFSVLDNRRGRIFTYDDRGNLLYTFGGIGNQKGTFTNPISITEFGDRLVVLDKEKGEITKFKPTKYAALIHKAIDSHYEGFYDYSVKMWNQVLNRNINFDLAYSGIGSSYFHEGEYEKALEYFKFAHDKKNYSRAFQEYRRKFIESNFSLIILGLILLLISLIIIIKAIKKYMPSNIKIESYHSKKHYYAQFDCEIKEDDNLINIAKKTFSSLRYSIYLLFHPFDGFWDLKNEKKGNLPASIIIVFLVIMTSVFIRFNTGYLFSQIKKSNINIWIEIISILIPLLLWCIVNWSITTLMDGKGSFKDIFIATSFALTPFVLINIPITIISNFLTTNEAGFYNFFINLSTMWTLLWIFLGTLTIHNYTIKKTILSTILIIIGMGLVFFLTLIFVDQIDMLIKFATTIYRELALRI